MATGDHISETRNFNRAVAGTDDNAAQTGTQNVFVKVGGVAQQTGTALSNGDEAALRLNRNGGLTPERMHIVVGTLTTAGATTTANLGSVTNIAYYKYAQFVIDVVDTGGSTATLTIYIDSNLQSGTVTNLAASAVMTTASRQVLQLTKAGSANVSTIVTGEAGAGTIRNVGWADDLRVRYTITGATSTFNASVTLNLIG